MSNKKKKYTNVLYKCLYCDKKYNRVDLVDHIIDEHEDEIPEGYSAARVVFDYVNKKPAGYNGKCTECGGPTGWDENKCRYNRQCSKKECHDSYVKKFEENMMKKKGTKRISQTEEGQKKMLANRKISGYYTFSDGVKKPYCGSYERKALEFMDKVMEISSSDILCPGPVLEYEFEGKKHMYITDFYYIPYDLIIEVKDGGENPNKRSMPEYRAKQIAKEQFIIKETNYNYIRLTDNKFEQLISVFMDLKMQLIDNTNERVIHVNENTDPIHEFMNALNAGQIPGIKDSGAYIVNYKQNNVFSNDEFGEEKFAITNSRSLKNLIAIDKDGIVSRLSSFDLLKDNEDDNVETKMYKLDKSLEEIVELFKDKINTEMTNAELFELATGKEYLFENQLDKLYERVETDDEYSKKLKLSLESYYDISNKNIAINEYSNEIDTINNNIDEVKLWINSMS